MKDTDNRKVSLAELPSSGDSVPASVNPRYRGLRPWKPGQSGNPAGGPKRKPLTDALAKALTPEVCEEIANTVVKQLKKGSIAHLHEVADRLEGKVADSDESRGNIVFNIKITAPRPYKPTEDDGQ